MNKLVTSSIAIALFLVAGCAASGPKLASSAEDIVGTWQSTVSSLEIQFSEDGTWRNEFGGNAPSIREFRFEGTRLFLKSVATGSCGAIGFDTGIYEVELLENGNLKCTVIEDECLFRVNLIAGRLVEVVFEPVP